MHDHAAVLQNVGAVGDFQRLVGVLLDQEHRHTVLAQLFDDVEDLLDDDRRQTQRWLVEQQQLGLAHQRAADGEHLLFTAGHGAAALVEALKVTYGPVIGTQGVSFTIEPGETVALIGSNGAGKSSTLKAIMGMVGYAEGRIVLDGKDLKGIKPSDIVRQGIGFSPEGRRVFPQLSVLDNLRVGGISREASELPERIERIYGYFPRLKERASQNAGSLSGGEQQMLAIGRALMSKPQLLLLDEPSLGLAPIIIQQIFDIIEQLRKDGVTVFLVEQNANQALKIADRAYVLENGRVVMQGTGEALLTDPKVREAYLGG